MSKKSVELSINVMIMMALGLAVLVVLFITLTSEAGVFSKTVLSCEAKGGQCMAENDCQCEKTSFKCTEKNKLVCCVNPLGR